MPPLRDSSAGRPRFECSAPTYSRYSINDSYYQYLLFISNLSARDSSAETVFYLSLFSCCGLEARYTGDITWHNPYRDWLLWWLRRKSICNAGDPGSVPRLERSPGEGSGNPLQYSCQENPMGGGTWRAIVHRVTKSQTRLSDFTSLVPCITEQSGQQCLCKGPDRRCFCGFPGGASAKEPTCQCRRHR